MFIEQYPIYEQIKESDEVLVYRTRRTNDPCSVVIRKLKVKNPTISENARFLKEYDIIKTLNAPSIVRTIDVFEEQGVVVLVLEDFSGDFLNDILKTKRFDIQEFLSLAIKLAQALDDLHGHGVIHGNINPRSIILDSKNMVVKLTDFGIDSLMTGSRSAIYNKNFILNTLPYLSPEQTGRVNRSEDYRSDFYALGITLFEMVTGIAPFKSKDPLELIHCHIARPPVRPDLFVPDLSATICDILMKLMAKAPEERYQSAFGLKSDLIECQKRLTDKGIIEPFHIAKQDVSSRFIIPQKLYGRENERKVLLETFENVCRGNNELLLVNGVSGIGKTALIYEIHKPIVAMRGHFIAGKYEQYKTDSPYSAIIQAFKGLLRQILSESKETTSQWKKRFQEALGPNVGVMTDIFPELELITGKQPPPAPIGPEEARNRFNLCIESFVSVFVSEKGPLVLFLDDLQWVDFSSLTLISNLILSLDARYLFFIFSYRSNEVSDAHPFIEMIREVENQGTKPRELTLGPLSEQHIGDLIFDFLKCSPEKALKLATLILKKTAGNPFFVNQYLKILYDQGKIFFDPEKGWQWDQKDIAAMEVTDNVVQLMADKISKLPNNTMEILKISSCIGNRFDIETLGHVLGKSLYEILTHMKLAIEEGYVRHVGDMFLYHHDRIQEAAYSLIPEIERAEYHLKIGRLMFEKATDANDLNAKLFYITDQFNQCLKLIVEPDERKRLFLLNMEAGKKAKGTAAFDPALKYFKTAESFLTKSSLSDKNKEDWLTVYQEIADTACLNGEYDLMTGYMQKAFDLSPSKLRRISICEIDIRAHFARQDYQTALTKSMDLLSDLGVAFQKKVKKIHIILELVRLKWMLRSMSEEKLLNLPPMENEEQLAIARIYSEMGISANLTDSTLYGYIVLKRFAQILVHGQNPYSGLCFLGYGAFLAFALEDYKNAVRFGDLAMKLAERPEGQAFKYRTHAIYAALIAQWEEPLEVCKAAAIKAYQLSREAGDQIYTSLSLTFRDYISFVTSSYIPELVAQMEKRVKITYKSGQRPMIQLYCLTLQFMHHISHDSPDPARLVGDYFSEDTVVPEWIETKNSGGLAHYYAIKVALFYFAHRYHDARQVLQDAEVHKQAVKNLLAAQFLTYFDCLVELARYPELSWADKLKARILVKKNLKKIRKWAGFEPVKQLPWIYLIQAELAAVLGQDTKARAYYDQAIDTFTHIPSPLFKSVSLFRASLYYMNTGQMRSARSYFSETLILFRATGVTLYELHYKQIWGEKFFTDSVGKSFLAHMETSRTGATLDLSTILKSAQALSGEIVLEKLLKTIMKISLESAGAQKGFLIVLHNEELVIVAEGTLDQIDVTEFSSMPADKSDQLSVSVVNFVERTLQPVVLAHACMEGEFVTDPYIEKNRIKSLLAAPMISSGKLKGIIYLENNLAAQVFSQERLEILDVLASQAAISLENAWLFDDVKTAEHKLRQFNLELEQRVKERTNELSIAYEQIKIMAHTDPLTGLANRRSMMDKIKQESLRFKRSIKPFALVIGDIDHFKSINDLYGHDCGDDVLVTLSRIMVSALREEDSVARWGGEEFLFLLPETGKDGAVTAIEKIRRALNGQSFQYNNTPISLTMTFGISIYDGKASDIEGYLKQADQALYIGKNSGRNQVVFQGQSLLT
ncbi:MAG: diguanylate cyclase [Proteobacteria bacterium]|nr:diguanylate cyclase [Pseudomonadota bacterium]